LRNPGADLRHDALRRRPLAGSDEQADRLPRVRSRSKNDATVAMSRMCNVDVPDAAEGPLADAVPRPEMSTLPDDDRSRRCDDQRRSQAVDMVEDRLAGRGRGEEGVVGLGTGSAWSWLIVHWIGTPSGTKVLVHGDWIKSSYSETDGITGRLARRTGRSSGICGPRGPKSRVPAGVGCVPDPQATQAKPGPG
jgi:hypothetical protein